MRSLFWRYALLLHLYYAVLLYFLAGKRRSLANASLPAEPVELLSWLTPENFHQFTTSLSFLAFVSLWGAMLWPWSRWFRIGAFLSVLFIIALESSYGKVIHGFYGWLWSALVLVFLPRVSWLSKKSVRESTQPKISELFFYAQLAAILSYFSAGLWKLRLLPQVLETHGFWGFMNSLNHTIAYEHVLHSHPLKGLSQFFLNFPLISGVSFLGLILLQSLSPLFLLQPRAHFLFGVLILLFHMASEIIVSIPFRAQTALMILLFIFLPLFIPAKTRFQKENLAGPRGRSLSNPF